jgi:hypothetical protein
MDRDTDELEATVDRFGAFLPEVLDRLERTCLSQALTTWTGYAAFCAESRGVAAEKVGAVVLAPVMGRVENMKIRAALPDIEADPETGEEISEGLAERWRILEVRGI